MPQALVNFFGPPPVGDLPASKPVQSQPKTTILRAVLGLKDVTDQVRSWLNASADGQLRFTKRQLVELDSKVDTWPQKGSPDLPMSHLLSFAVAYKISEAATTHIQSYNLDSTPIDSPLTLSGPESGDFVRDDLVYPENIMAISVAGTTIQNMQFPALFTTMKTALTQPSPDNVGSFLLTRDIVMDRQPNTMEAFYIFYRRVAGGDVLCAIGIKDLQAAKIQN